MTELGLTLFLFYGLLLGARHALEPDHLAAVSTMAAHGRSRREILTLATAWGAGHATLIAAIGTLLILLPWHAPEWLEARAEALVGLLMVAMGCYVLWNLQRGKLHVHRHRHGSRGEHVHIHRHHQETEGVRAGHFPAAPELTGNEAESQERPGQQPAGHGPAAHHPPRHEHTRHTHPAEPTWMRRPLAAYLVGTVHGLAGSGAAIALAVAAAPSTGAAVLYLLLFALGSVAGMAVAAVAALWPIVLLSSRSLRAQQLVQRLAGSASLAIGLYLIYGTFI